MDFKDIAPSPPSPLSQRGEGEKFLFPSPFGRGARGEGRLPFSLGERG